VHDKKDKVYVSVLQLTNETCVAQLGDCDRAATSN